MLYGLSNILKRETREGRQESKTADQEGATGKGEIRLRRFVLASVAPLKGESNALSQKVALICAGVRFERNLARAQSQTTAWPGSEEAGSNGRQVHGRRRTESRGDGANSPAMKFSGTDDCRWTAGGFAVICKAALSWPEGNIRKLLRLLRSDFQDIPIPRS